MAVPPLDVTLSTSDKQQLVALALRATQAVLTRHFQAVLATAARFLGDSERDRFLHQLVSLDADELKRSLFQLGASADDIREVMNQVSHRALSSAKLERLYEQAEQRREQVRVLAESLAQTPVTAAGLFALWQEFPELADDFYRAHGFTGIFGCPAQPVPDHDITSAAELFFLTDSRAFASHQWHVDLAESALVLGAAVTASALTAGFASPAIATAVSLGANGAPAIANIVTAVHRADRADVALSSGITSSETAEASHDAVIGAALATAASVVTVTTATALGWLDPGAIRRLSRLLPRLAAFGAVDGAVNQAVQPSTWKTDQPITTVAAGAAIGAVTTIVSSGVASTIGSWRPNVGANPVGPAASFPSEAELKSRAAAQLFEREGVSFRTRDQFIELLHRDTLDVITDFARAEARIPTIERAIVHAEATGERPIYVTADVRNLGGLNRLLKPHGANIVYRRFATIFAHALKRVDGKAFFFRQGGDEISAVIIGPNVRLDDVRRELIVAETLAEQFAKDSGLAHVQHPKHPTETAYWGTGLATAAVEITATSTRKSIFDQSEALLSRRSRRYSRLFRVGATAKTNH